MYIHLIVHSLVVQVYQICSICLGTPPTTFDWEYKDKDDKYVCHENISPLQFYEQFVKPVFNMNDKVSLPYRFPIILILMYTFN